MATNDFFYFATAGGANVESQATWAADPQTTAGFTASTTATSPECNKAWRQASMGSALLGLFINTWTGLDCLDDGVLSTKVVNFQTAILTLASKTGVLWGGTSGGSANSQTITTSPLVATYSAGQVFGFIPGFTNTSDTTLNPNSLGAVHVRKRTLGGLVVLSGGELRAGLQALVEFDGTFLVLQSFLYPSNPVLNIVSSVNGSTTSGHFPIFDDTAGSVQDSGIAPSNAAKAIVSSVNGATVSGNIPVFDDTAGTVQDSGISAASIAAAIAASPVPFRSALNTTWSAGNSFSYAHTLGSLPDIWMIRAECVSAQGGYGVGKYINLTGHVDATGSVGTTFSRNVTVAADAANLYAYVGADGLYALDTTGHFFLLDNAHWSLQLIGVLF